MRVTRNSCRGRRRGVQPRWQPEQREQLRRPEEERHLDDLPAAQLEHLQRPRLVAARVAGFVLAERRRAVRRPRRQHARTSATDPRAEPPGEDVVAAGQPQVIRRHRLRRVLVDERRQRLNVVGLERPHVARQQLRVGHAAVRVRTRRAWVCSPPSSSARAAGRCSPTRRWSRGVRRPRWPSTAALRRGSALPAAAAGGAAARPRTPAAPSRGRRRPPPGRLGAPTNPAGRARASRVRVVGAGAPHGLAAGPQIHRAGAPLVLRSMSRQTLVAIRYSHARNVDRPSKVSRRRQARRNVSCTVSSASSNDPSIR